MKEKKTTPGREETNQFPAMNEFLTQEELDEDLESLDRALKNAAQRQKDRQQPVSRRPLPDQGSGAEEPENGVIRRKKTSSAPKSEPESESKYQTGKIVRQPAAASQVKGEVEPEVTEAEDLHEAAAGVKMLGWVFRKVKGQSEVTVVTAAEPTEEAELPQPESQPQTKKTPEEPEEKPEASPKKETASQPKKVEVKEKTADPASAAKKKTKPVDTQTAAAQTKTEEKTAIPQGPEPARVRPRRLKPEVEEPAAEAAQSGQQTAAPKKKRRLWPFGKVKDKTTKYTDSLFVGDEILQGTDLTQEEKQEARREELRRKGLAGSVPGPDEEDVYVEVEDPDTWEEEEAEETRKKPRREKVHIPLPDIPARTLATIFGDGIGKERRNIMLSLILCLPILYINLADSLNLPIFSALWDDKLAAAVVLEGLGLVTLLLRRTFGAGIGDLFRGNWGMHTITSFAVLLTLLDGAYFVFLGREGPMPCCGVAALCLVFTSWGRNQKACAQRISCRSASITDTPTRLVMERDEQGELTQVMLSVPGDAHQFGSQIQEPDGVEQMSRPVVLVLLIGGLVFSLLAALGSGAPQRLLWCASVIFTMASPLSSTMAYGLPYFRIAKKLNQAGAALAGWEGVQEIGRCRRVVVDDNDLFPTGRVSCHGLHLYGRAAIDIVSGYACAMIKASGSGLTRAFSELAITQNANDWPVANFQMYHGGGCSGTIRSDQVLVGSAAFMRAMEIPMPEESTVKTAVFCAINGELAGQIVLSYKLPGYVNPALNTMIRNRLIPVMCQRDFLLTPDVLKQKFGMNLRKAEFPTVDDKLVLTTPELGESGKLSALLGREGLAVHGDTVVGGRRLYKAARRNGWFTLVASILGMLLGFYLTFLSAFASLQPGNILLFLAMWLVPTLLISFYVDRY